MSSDSAASAPTIPAETSTRMRPDAYYIYAARALRGFGDGFAIIILPVYLLAIGLNPQQVGMVASASLLGTAGLTLFVGFVAPRYDLRNLFLLRRRAHDRYRAGVSDGSRPSRRCCSSPSSGPSIRRRVTSEC